MSDKLVKPPKSEAAYRKAEIRMALSWCPEIYPCAACGWPVLQGYICKTCGNTNPGSNNVQPAARRQQ